MHATGKKLCHFVNGHPVDSVTTGPSYILQLQSVLLLPRKNRDYREIVIYRLLVFIQVLGKLVMSEGRYVSDLSTLVNMYYQVFKTAITSGHLVMPRDQLDVIFLNWYKTTCIFSQYTNPC